MKLGNTLPPSIRIADAPVPFLKPCNIVRVMFYILFVLYCLKYTNIVFYCFPSGNRTPGGSRFYSDLASTSSYSSVFQSARLLV